MSSYEYTHTSGSSLLIRDSSYPDRILLRVGFSKSKEGMHIPNADVPTIAAELLKAAGRDDLGGYLTAVVEKEAAAAEWAANEAEKKLQERRDALTAAYGWFCWEVLSPPSQKFIDDYLALEDKLAAK